jgi:nucleotide-binding universal stress UspA family protein
MKNEIVVGLDDSRSSEAAMEWAAQQAKTTGAVLRAVHALNGPTWLRSPSIPLIHPIEVSPMTLMELEPDQLQDSYRAAIIENFQAVSPNPDWVLQFVNGYAGEALVRLSDDAQLLVVGTREHVGLDRLLVGSVSHYCLSRARCPVVAVPAPAHEPADTEESLSEQPTAVSQTESAEEQLRVHASHGPLIIAGVDGSAESLAAARYAAAAAGMRSCDLMLVHAFSPPPPTSAQATMTALADSRTDAGELMTAAAAQLSLSPHVQLHTLAEPGGPTAVLAMVAQWADMLVLGRDKVSWGERVMMGAVTSQVARRVTCPLVVVPSGWRAGHVGKPPPVVVALDTESSGEAALALAFREAELRRTRLVVLHAERIGRPARDVAAAGFDLAVLLAKWKEDHPKVAVSTIMVSGDPDTQLVRWSRSAAVLVMGRPHQRGWGSWMRSVARSVMRQTHCPLIIAPQNPIRVEERPASAARAALA